MLKSMMPCEAMAMTMARVALEALMRMVKTVPARTARMMATKPRSEKFCRKSKISGEGLGIASAMKPSPRKMSARPIRAFP